MPMKKDFRTNPFLMCWVLASLLSACTTLPDSLKPTAPQAGDHMVYRVLEKNVPMTARKYVGVPYQWGADPDEINGSDCSHLVAAVTRNSLSGSGFKLHTTYFDTDDIKKSSFPVKKSDVRVGDIVFFRDEDGPSKAKHAGIVTARKGDTIFFIQASSSRGVMVNSTEEMGWKEYWQQRFDSFRRWKASVFAGM